MCVLSIKVPIRKKSGNLFNEPCRYALGQYLRQVKSDNGSRVYICWEYFPCFPNNASKGRQMS